MMSANYRNHIEMIVRVAEALGDDLLQDFVFVGGCVIGLLLTDTVSKEQVRMTHDVDLIVSVLSYSEWKKLEKLLYSIGFKPSTEEGAPICAMQLDNLRVDFMPDDERILNFSNRWYKDALRTATNYKIGENLNIKIVNPVYCVGTKFEAYLGRGKDDPIESRDIEDILNIFDGREEIVEEINKSPQDIRSYIAKQIRAIFGNKYFFYAIQSASQGMTERERIIITRLKAVS